MRPLPVPSGAPVTPGPAGRRGLAFGESVIREMTRLAEAAGAVNLAQGLPDFACPAELKEAAVGAVVGDRNQYATTWGLAELRAAVAAKTARCYPGWCPDPEEEVTVTCGATEAMAAACLALLEPGDEVVLFEPAYENYLPDVALAGAVPRPVRLRPPHWDFDAGELRGAFGPRTRAVVLNTPHNPTGRMFDRAELALVAELCQRWDALVLTDEIYEHIHYRGPGAHLPPLREPGLEDRTVSVNSVSKTYSATGWRVGWTIAESGVTRQLRKVHDYLTVAAPTPLQAAAAVALRLPPAYYDRLAAAYRERRDFLAAVLRGAGFEVGEPPGAYYLLCGTGRVDPAGQDVAFVRRLTTATGVAAVPGSSFFSHPADGRRLVRFAFCKRMATLRAAGDRLAGPPRAGGG